MKAIQWFLISLALAACAHGKMGTIAQPLAKDAITKTTPIFVETVSTTEAKFTGDKATETARVNQEKSEIEARYSAMIVEQLRKKGFNATVAKGPVKTGVVLTGNVTLVQHGSAAARIFAGGMGAGSANMFTNFKLEDKTDGKVLSKFEVIATSGGRGGLAAAGSFLDAHLADGSQKVAQYIAGEAK